MFCPNPSRTQGRSLGGFWCDYKLENFAKCKIKERGFEATTVDTILELGKAWV